MTYCKYISYNLYYSNIVNMFIALLFYSMTNVDKALGLFEAEMKAQDLWDAVTVVTVSDFGRTLTFNGLGTDHAWGGNYFIAGGNVSGAQIHGRYPDRLTEEESNLNIGRGRILPTLPWESMWEGLAQWMGVPASDMATVLPNLKKFPASHRLNSSELFDVDPTRAAGPKAKKNPAKREPCRPGTFNAKPDNSTKCFPHTTCPNGKVRKNGTATNNAVCEPSTWLCVIHYVHLSATSCAKMFLNLRSFLSNLRSI